MCVATDQSQRLPVRAPKGLALTLLRKVETNRKFMRAPDLKRSELPLTNALSVIALIYGYDYNCNASILLFPARGNFPDVLYTPTLAVPSLG